MTIHIGIDAGVASGFALLKPGDLVPELAEYPDINDLVADMSTRIMKGTPLVIYYEKFIISSRTVKTKVEYDTLLFNGWLHHEGRRYPYIKTEGFTPAQAKGFATDTKLKKLDWYAPSKDGHQNDAARVLLYGLTKERDARVIDGLRGLH